MIRIEMSDINREGIHISGGWEARIPSISLNPHEEAVYVAYYVKHHGMNEAAAIDHVQESMDALWARAWTHTLREAIVGAAKHYMNMWPQLGLQGFNPEIAQRAYVPGDNVGQAGKPALRELLKRMGETENANQKNL